jgi:hypothetical protein
VDRVSETELVTQATSDPVREAGACPEDVIKDDERGIVGVCTADPEVPEEEMNLAAIRLVNLNSNSSLRKDGLTRSDVFARLPIREELIEEALHLLAVDISADGDGRSARDPSPLVMRAQRSRLNLRDALQGSISGATHPVIAVDLTPEGQPCLRLRVLLFDEQAVLQALLLKPNTIGWEGRPQDHICEDRGE